MEVCNLKITENATFVYIFYTTKKWHELLISKTLNRHLYDSYFGSTKVIPILEEQKSLIQQIR